MPCSHTPVVLNLSGAEILQNFEEIIFNSAPDMPGHPDFVWLLFLTHPRLFFSADHSSSTQSEPLLSARLCICYDCFLHGTVALALPIPPGNLSAQWASCLAHVCMKAYLHACLCLCMCLYACPYTCHRHMHIDMLPCMPAGWRG